MMYVYCKLNLPNGPAGDIKRRVCCEFVFDEEYSVSASIPPATIYKGNGSWSIDYSFSEEDSYDILILGEVHNDILQNYDTVILRVGVWNEYSASDSQERISFENCDTIYEIDLTAPPVETANSYEHLEVGSKGDAVVSHQKKLIDLGFLSGNADGIYGNATAEGVRQFQESEDLPETGKADAATQERLYSK